MSGEKLVLEQFLKKNNGDHVYPITILKFLLNKERILFYFNKVGELSSEFTGMVYKVDNIDCPSCKKVSPKYKFCRQHFSINRIITSQSVPILKDVETGLFFIKNEIFKINDDKMTIVYCPHTKLIHKELTQDKIKKVYPVTIIDPKIKNINFKKVHEFDSKIFTGKTVSCWFNEQFTILASPSNKFEGQFVWNLAVNN